MAVNVDSPKRRSLRLQDANADVDSETPSISSGANRPANARTSDNEKRLSAERRIDTAGQERSLRKRRSTEPPHKENETDRKEKRGSSTNTMGPNTAKSWGPMEPNTIEPPRVQSPGRRSHNSSSLHAADSSRAAMDNTSFSRETRSSKAKNIKAGMANRPVTDDAISSKEKNDNTHLDQRKEQGSEDSGEVSSQNKSLRARRSHDNSTTNRGATETNTMLKRQNRSSGGRVNVEAEDSIATRSKGAISNKEKTENAHHAESRSPKKITAEDPDRSNRRNRSYDVEDSSTTTQMLKRKTRASGANLEEPAVVKQDESPVLSKKNPKLSENSFQQGKGSEDPGRSNRHNRSCDVEDSSTTINQILKRKTRASGANHEEPAVVKQDESPALNKKNPKLSEISLEDSSTTTQMLKRKTRASGANHEEPAVVKQDESPVLSKKNPKLSETSFQQGKGSEDSGESNSRNKSFNVEDSAATTQMLKRKTRASGANLEELAVVKQDESIVLSQQNPKLSETNFQQGEGSEGPDGSNSHINLRPRRNDNSNVEGSPRRSGVSTGANASFNKETRSSKAKDYEESGASTAVQGIGVRAVSSQIRKSVHFSKTDNHENQRSDGLDWRESYTRSLQQLEDHTDASDHIKDCPKGFSLPTKSCDLVSEDGRSSKEKDKEAGASTERDNNNELVNKEERIGRPSNHSEKETDVSCGVRSPRKNLTPRRNHNGFGISETSVRTPSKDQKGGPEPPVHIGEVLRVPGESISPRKRLQKTLNFEDPPDETRQPSNVTTENDTGGAARDYKVQCCSKQLLKEVLGMCTGICEEILDSQQYLNPEQKQQHHKNLAWDFETAFQENVSLRGMSWHEAPDEDSEPDVEILEEQMDEAIVRTSMKRRRYPRKILSQFVKALKTEREILNQYKPVVNPKRVSLDPAIECRMKELSTTAATVCQHIHETKKALPIQLEKAAGFSQVLNLQPSLAESRIRKDIFYSRVVLEDISKSTPKVLETTLPQSEPKDLATPVRNLRKRRVSLPQRHLYPIRSKRKINLES